QDWHVVPVRVADLRHQSQSTCMQANAAAEHHSVARRPIRAVMHVERLPLRWRRQKRSARVDRAIHESRRISDLHEWLHDRKWKRLLYDYRKLPDIGVRIDVRRGERSGIARAKSFARVERIEFYPEPERHSDIDHRADNVSFGLADSGKVDVIG